MADIRKIRVMISSRSMTTVFGGTALSDIRLRLQERLHFIRWSTMTGSGLQAVGRDQALFDVWIHETDPGQAGDKSTLQISLREIRRADIILVLYTGEAGSAAHEREIGICHAEFLEAISRRPEILSVVELAPIVVPKNERDRRFQADMAKRQLFSTLADTEGDLLAKVLELLQERISILTGRGSSSGSRKLDRGQALDWNRLDLVARQMEMRNALMDVVAGVSADTSTGEVPLTRLSLQVDEALVVRIDAIAASLTIAAARERVGQPFQRDHRHYTALKQLDAPGIVHLIACHRNVTESQALRMLGSPDSIAVASDFGIYAADHVMHTQIIFLAHCSDETATALAYRKFTEWLTQSGEGARVVVRAKARERVLEVLHELSKVDES